MKHARSSARLLDQRGVTWVTAALALGIALAAYLTWVWVPVYVVQYEAKQVVRDYGNQAVKNPNDAELVERMVQKLRLLEERPVVGEDGRVTRVPTVDVRPNDVVWERISEPTRLHVAFEYAREVRYPIIDRSIEKVFQVDMTLDISRPDWGPMR